MRGASIAACTSMSNTKMLGVLMARTACRPYHDCGGSVVRGRLPPTSRLGLTDPDRGFGLLPVADQEVAQERGHRAGQPAP
jgi:hypothetical protein